MCTPIRTRIGPSSPACASLAAAKASDQIRASEQKIADELRKLGKTVVQVDREAFRKAAIPLHNDASAGAGWTQAQYDELQALK